MNSNHPEMCFLDVEASSLFDGFPIEVGWVFVRDFKVWGSSFLIRPEESWLEDVSRWSSESQEVHGISRRDLLANGIPVSEARQRLATELAEKVVYSDAVRFDGEWLQVLFNGSMAAPLSLPFTLAWIGEAYAGSITDEVAYEREIRKRANFRTEHRAYEDALDNALMWCHCRHGIRPDRFQYPRMSERFASSLLG